MRIKLDNKEIECDGKKTILEICKDNGMNIPTLCYQDGLKPEARCRICLVELDGKLVTSCSNYPKENCNIITNS